MMLDHSEDAGADVEVLAQAIDWFENPDASPLHFTPISLENAFSEPSEAGVGPRQMRVIENIFDRALGEIFEHAARHRPEDLGTLLRWLHHLRIEEPVAPTSLLGG